MLSLRALAHVTRNAHMPSPERCWIRTTQSGGAQDDETVTVGMKVVGVIYRSNPEVSASSTVACGEYAHLVQRVQETIFRSVALAGFVPLTSRPYDGARAHEDATYRVASHGGPLHQQSPDRARWISG